MKEQWRFDFEIEFDDVVNETASSLACEGLPITNKQIDLLVDQFRMLLVHENAVCLASMAQHEPDELAAWRRCPKCQGMPITTHNLNDRCGLHFRKET